LLSCIAAPTLQASAARDATLNAACRRQLECWCKPLK